jgi:hypothetical protein
MDSTAYSGIMDGIYGLFKLAGVALVIFVPLGLWKAIEIIAWAFNHFSIGVK